MSVVIETTLGDLTVDLFLKDRPRACLNFIKLCKLKYYNFNLFHTIQAGFIAQTGDPAGEGNGGESVWGLIEGPEKRFFEAEYLPKIRHSEPGLLSMVSLGDSLIGSQFFFTLGSDLTSLDGVHVVIGQVVEGLDVLRAINEVICDDTHRPYKDVRITHTVILDDPFENPRGFREPSRSPSPSAERLKGGRIAADEEIDETTGKTEAELAEMRLEREAKARATILEIIGDLPDAEIAPPENVLFVCKLNSVTNDDDLEIIFSRFGKIKGCEVIRDRKSGDSLQYAFIEFEDKKACEMAYFKMDNVLIDDRRIHVDFSQSVSKLQWKGKGKGFIMKDGTQNTRLDFNNYNKPVREKDRENRGNNSRSNRDGPSRNYGDERQRSPRRNDRRERQRSRSRSPINDRQRSRSRSPRDRRRRSNDRSFSRRNYSPDRRQNDRGLNRRDERDLNNRRNDDRRRYNERPRRSRTPEKRVRRRSRSIEKSRRSRSVEKRRQSPSGEKRDKRRSRSVEKRRQSSSPENRNESSSPEKRVRRRSDKRRSRSIEKNRRSRSPEKRKESSSPEKQVRQRSRSVEKRDKRRSRSVEKSRRSPSPNKRRQTPSSEKRNKRRSRSVEKSSRSRSPEKRHESSSPEKRVRRRSRSVEIRDKRRSRSVEKSRRSRSPEKRHESSSPEKRRRNQSPLDKKKESKKSSKKNKKEKSKHKKDKKHKKKKSKKHKKYSSSESSSDSDTSSSSSS